MPNNPITGGEFPFHPEMLMGSVPQDMEELSRRRHPGYHISFTGGGYYSLKVILSHLKSLGYLQHPVWLPSYLCPTILRPFHELSVPYRFYPVDQNLHSDLTPVGQEPAELQGQVIFIIPYFGFPLPDDTRIQLLQLRSEGAIVIEDRAQCLFPGFDPVGDYVFYSFRKFMPVDGSILLSKDYISFYSEGNADIYLNAKDAATELKYRYIHHGSGSEQLYLDMFRYAEHHYYTDGVAGFPDHHLDRLSRWDLEAETEGRRRSYALLDELLKDLAVLRNPGIQEASPLCYPIRAPHRNRLRELLRMENIFAAVHWEITEQDVPGEFKTSHALSNTLLSLPVRSNLPDETCRCMAHAIRKLIRQ